MEPNKWGIIRQKDLNLLALPMLQLLNNFSEYEIEIVNNPLETYPDKVFSNNGTLESKSNFTAYVFDISKYDYVAFPVVGSHHTNCYSGLSDTLDGQLGKTLRISQYGIAYDMISVRTGGFTPYAKISLNNEYNDNTPLLGFILHRSDNVNPREIIQPLVSGNLRQAKDLTVQEPEEKQEEEQEEA